MRSVLLKSRGTDNKGQRTLAEFWVVVDTIISWVVLLYFSASSTRAATNIVQATLRLLSFRYFFACLPKRVRDRRRSNQERAPDAYRSACVGPLNANGVGCSSTLWRWFCAYVSSRDWASESRLASSAIVGQCSLLPCLPAGRAAKNAPSWAERLCYYQQKRIQSMICCGFISSLRC